eukprot:4262614-Prymnesium_polylepis.1
MGCPAFRRDPTTLRVALRPSLLTPSPSHLLCRKAAASRLVTPRLHASALPHHTAATAGPRRTQCRRGESGLNFQTGSPRLPSYRKGCAWGVQAGLQR